MHRHIIHFVTIELLGPKYTVPVKITREGKCVEKPDVKKYIPLIESKLSESEKIDGMITAVKSCHDKSVCHGGIKMSNFLYNVDKKTVVLQGWQNSIFEPRETQSKAADVDALKKCILEVLTDRTDNRRTYQVILENSFDIKVIAKLCDIDIYNQLYCNYRSSYILYLLDNFLVDLSEDYRQERRVKSKHPSWQSRWVFEFSNVIYSHGTHPIELSYHLIQSHITGGEYVLSDTQLRETIDALSRYYGYDD